MVEVLVPEVLRVAAELRVPLPRGHLEVVVADPPRHPADIAVAGQEAASEAEAAQGSILQGRRAGGGRHSMIDGSGRGFASFFRI